MANTNFINELKAVLQQYPQVKLAILFGSFVKETETADSDIDLAVAADHVLSSQEKIEIMTALAEKFARPIDLIDLQLKHEPILSQVLTTGEKVIHTDNSLYAELIKTMWYDQADFIPYRSRILQERRQAWIDS